MPRIVAVSAMTALNSAIYHTSKIAYRRRVANVDVRAPIFIIGHWRTGTTLLHELLDSDPRLQAPTTYQCMFPSTFLPTQGLVGRWTRGMLPATRPFDNMVFGPDKPQEDEFALLNAGLGTPYVTLAFPRRGPAGLRYVDLADLDDVERLRWENGYEEILRRFQLDDDRRLVLKSPVHAGRIPTLLKLFPDARFIFTARDPFDIFTSHVRTLKVLAANQGLHNPIPADDQWVKDYVLEMFIRLFEAYERDRAQIPPGRLVEMRYEDFTAAPLERLEALYRELELGDFAPARAAVVANLADRKGYRRNANRIDAQDRAIVAARWAKYRDRFGYAEQSA